MRDSPLVGQVRRGLGDERVAAVVVEFEHARQLVRAEDPEAAAKLDAMILFGGKPRAIVTLFRDGSFDAVELPAEDAADVKTGSMTFTTPGGFSELIDKVKARGLSAQEARGEILRVLVGTLFRQVGDVPVTPALPWFMDRLANGERSTDIFPELQTNAPHQRTVPFLRERPPSRAGVAPLWRLLASCVLIVEQCWQRLRARHR